MDNSIVENRDTILKSNILIDSSYKLTLQEQRILNIACKKLIPIFINKNVTIEEFTKMAETKSFELIEIGVADYLGLHKTKSKAVYKELEKVATSLYEKEIIYFDDNEDLTRKRWVITCKYKDRQGKIALKFHPDLVTDLLMFQTNFTPLNYTFLNGVKSFYSSRMYELLRQYMFIGKRTFELEDLRFKLGLSDKEYPKYANFKQRILKPSIEWINSNSDIYVEYSEDKCGTRSVKNVTFKIYSKEKIDSGQETQLSLLVDQDNSLYKNIKDILQIDLTAEQVESISKSAVDGITKNNVKKGSLDYIREKWEVAKTYADKSKNPNYIGALIKALENNWGGTQNKPKLKFDNFSGRQYTDEQWNDIEQGLRDSSMQEYL